LPATIWQAKIRNAASINSHPDCRQTLIQNVALHVGIIALAGLAALIWLVRNRTHLVAPEPVNETRRVAATVRDSDI